MSEPIGGPTHVIEDDLFVFRGDYYCRYCGEWWCRLCDQDGQADDGNEYTYPQPYRLDQIGSQYDEHCMLCGKTVYEPTALEHAWPQDSGAIIEWAETFLRQQDRTPRRHKAKPKKARRRPGYVFKAKDRARS